MAMNRNVTMAEKEVRDYAKRQMERAEQRESILFTEEQKEQVLEYAVMTGDDYDIRKMVRDLADAVRSSDEEEVDEILRDAREEIDGFPDRSVGMAELKGYGYTGASSCRGKGVLLAVRWLPWGLCQQRDDTGT